MKRNPSHGQHLKRLTLNGYKSIAKCDLEFGAINVLIGCNGAGKSNLISFFKMIQQMLDGNLQLFISRSGGPDSILHFGRRTTETLLAKLFAGDNTIYKTSLEATQDNRLMIAEESLCSVDQKRSEKTQLVNRGHFESIMLKDADLMSVSQITMSSLRSWRIYHFHDTSDNAYVKQLQQVSDNSYLRPDARNLAAFLFFLEKHHHKEFQLITETVKMVAPFFGRFHLKPSVNNQEIIELQWFEAGQDIPFKAHHLSDGTLRFICLTTVFLQPADLQPETILVDEPELGLHPYAISVLGALIRSAAKTKQVIISTQSVELLNEFAPQDVIVVDRKDGKSEFRRLEENNLQEWLQEYTLGELWKKNIIGGRPAK